MDFFVAKEKAIKYILMAKKTEFEVKNRLKKYGCSEDIIEEVIEYLIKIKYLDDSDYMDAYLRQSMSLLNYSLYEIKQKMLQKGIKKCIIEEKLEEFQNNGYEKKVIDKLLKGKCKSMECLKQKQYLYRRGFIKLYSEE